MDQEKNLSKPSEEATCEDDYCMKLSADLKEEIDEVTDEAYDADFYIKRNILEYRLSPGLDCLINMFLTACFNAPGVVLINENSVEFYADVDLNDGAYEKIVKMIKDGE